MINYRRSRKWQILYFLIGGILILSFGFNIWQTQRAQDQLKTQYVTSNTPTIFLHGWSSSLRSEKDMVSAAEVSGAASRRMIIHVRPNGKLKVTGTIKKWMVNPIILVRMDNNRAGEVQYAHWLTKVCKMLKQKYHVNELNFVGHSMGAYAVIYYNLMNGNNKDVPRANKLCVIAGPYDGIMDNHKSNQPTSGPLMQLWDDAPNQNRILATGKPKIIHPEYRLLYRLRKNFPHQARVLNIYGNLGDGSNSDGVVTTASALSLGYILRDHVSFYQTFEAFGDKAQHSALHNNNLAVNKILTEFLWDKNYRDNSASELMQ
ncbi:alpha/beta hydrolase [Lentilactobacillus parabuchneri]|nr:alpha/beta hydrolase [Lentilactobacillus parabuchneri]MBW0222509.1 alpha/beta hydrolase [Lentilactobacillus parabuchneri]MBW0244694.1 alpha/beta hydrolase [Lentilactobacillus parabuchneri]MBW0262772.1 alpha/beta hydrolase [Lentilactobacillus parabuchneri]MCT2884589.1 alpha/beta hydrolase [Lentilactobacillus parabuchneri]MDG9738085.1 alpha/beta hydrolase [Lentilactobacillus parabuchneri]